MLDLLVANAVALVSGKGVSQRNQQHDRQEALTCQLSVFEVVATGLEIFEHGFDCKAF